LVASEMMVGSSGLGYLILANTQVFRFSEAYAAVVLVSLCGLVTHFALHNVQKILKGRVVG
jgi:ABC-type nitrate/sulfonate/bicarbonate transport system permease component